MYDEAYLRGGAERSRRGRVAGLAARIALDVNLVAIAALVALVRGASENNVASSPLVSFAIMTESSKTLSFSSPPAPVSSALAIVLTAFLASKSVPTPPRVRKEVPSVAAPLAAAHLACQGRTRL